MVKYLRKGINACIQLLFPLRCPVCDEIVTPFGEKICFDCMKKLKVITPPRCLKCGKKLEDEEQIKLMEKLIDIMEEDDDVQNIWHNWDQE